MTLEFRRQLVQTGLREGLDLNSAFERARAIDAWCDKGQTTITIVEAPRALPAPVVDHVEPGRKGGRPKRADRKPVRPMGRTPKAGGITIQGRVFAAIEAAGASGISRADVARLTKLDAGQVGPAAQKLRDDGRIAVVGRTIKARYVAQKFRPRGADARAKGASFGRTKGSPEARPSAGVAAGAGIHAGKGVNGGANSDTARPASPAPDGGGNGAAPLAVPAPTEQTPVSIVRAAIAAAGGGGISRTALGTRTGLDAVTLDGALTACLMKGRIVERDRLFYARGHGPADGEAALAASPVSVPSFGRAS